MLLAESKIELIVFGTLLFTAFLIVRVGLHYIDKSVVTSAARQKGWNEIEVRWRPFSSGWFFEKGERYYHVSYIDKDGSRKSRICKTSLLTGVFWRD